jgi:hypothetical protein
MRANHLTFISNTFTRAGKQEAISPDEYDKIYNIITELPDYVGQIVSCLHQYMTETPIGIGMNENDPRITKLETGEYPTLFMILPDKIIFHKVCVYQQNMTMNDPIDMKPSQFVTVFTLEIDPTTLIGSIQIDKYDIKSYVKEFEEAHAKNFEIASAIAQKRTFMTTLREIFTQKSKRYGPITVHIDPNTGKKVSNVYHKSLVENAKRGEQYDTATLYDIIELLELDTKKKEEKLAEFDEIKDDHVKLTFFITSYNANTQMEIEALEKSYDFGSVNEKWYNTFSITPPDFIRTLNSSSYDITIQQAIDKIITQPDLHRVITTQFMGELEKRMEYYKKYYDTKSKINKKENDSMIVLRSDNNLSELLERITESRAANANTWLPSLSRIFKRRAITGDIDEREKFHDRMRLKTGVVADANVTCARASAYYTLFQTLVNEIGTYLSNKRDIPYTKKKVIVTNCDIITTQPIDLSAPAEDIIERIETKEKISPPEVKILEGAVTTVVEEVNKIETAAEINSDEEIVSNITTSPVIIAATDTFDDELAKKIAIAAVVVLLQDFEDEHIHGVTITTGTSTSTPSLNIASTSAASSAPNESQAIQESSVMETSSINNNNSYEEVPPPPSGSPPLSVNDNSSHNELPPPPPSGSPPLSVNDNSSHNELSPPIKKDNLRRKYRNEIPSYQEIIEKSLPEYKAVLGNDPNIQRTLTILDRIDMMRDKTYNDNIRNQTELSAVRDELAKHSKNLRSKLLAYVRTPSTTKNNKGKKIGRDKVKALLTTTMDGLLTELTDLDDTLNGLKEVSLENSPLFKEINNVAKGLPSTPLPTASAPLPTASAPLPAASVPASAPASVPASVSSSTTSVVPPISVSSSSTNNKALTATKKTINGMITGLTGKVNNRTENFKKKNNSTAELKKKFRSLNQQLKNEGANFSSSPAKNEASNAVVEPEVVVKPVTKPVTKPLTNSLNALMAAPKKITSKKVSLTNNEAVKLELTTLHNTIDQLISAGTGYSGNHESEVANYIKTLRTYLPQLEEYQSKNITYQIESVKDFIEKCNVTIDNIKQIIYPTLGGKRRTQKKRKHKKRFGTQKK